MCDERWDTMRPLLSDPPGRSRPGARPRRAAATGPLVLVLPGQERFTRGVDAAALEHAVVGRFPNGELHVDVPARVDGRRCVVVGSISPPPGNLERVTLLAHALRRAGASRITALLPYLAYTRQDRARPTESLGLAWVGGLLRASGVDEVVGVDVHSEAAGEVLGLPLTSLSSASLLATALPQTWREGVTFVAPDEGAIGRCAAIAEAAGARGPIVHVRKRRTPAGLEHLGIVGKPGRRALVADDILDTGDTLVSCVRHLRGAGVEEIAIVATHGLFTGERWHALLREGVERLWITDTVLSRRRPPEAEVVPVASLLVLAGVID